MQTNRARIARKSSAAVAVAAISFSTLFAGIPVSHADEFDDDGGSSYDYDDSGSYDDGGYDDSYDDSGSYDEGSYDDSGSEWDYDGEEFEDTDEGDEPDEAPEEEPSGGGEETEEPEAPGGGMEPETPGGGGMETEAPAPAPAPEPAPGGGMETEPPGGGMETETPEPTPGGGMETETPGGGKETEAPGGGMETETPGGGMNTEAPGGGMHTDDNDTGGGVKTDEETAPADDVEKTEDTKSVQTAAETMTSDQSKKATQSIKKKFNKGNYSKSGKRLRSPVSRWNSKWTGYDRNYRPVFSNPYKQPMKVMYRADGKQQVLTIPPMEKAVLTTRMKPGTYSFTSMTGPEDGPPTNVSVGSFSGGGFKPRPGQAPPQKPPVHQSIKNALVQVKYAQGTSEPFHVTSLTDLGKDSSVNNLTRVLLDGEIPAWGEWGKNDKGEAMFSISETQLLPGVKPPAQDPLPGYDIKLVSSNKTSKSWLESNRIYVVVAGAVAGLLALIGVAVLVLRRRKGGDDDSQTEVLGSDEPTTYFGSEQATTPFDDKPYGDKPYSDESFGDESFGDESFGGGSNTSPETPPFDTSSSHAPSPETQLAPSTEPMDPESDSDAANSDNDKPQR